MISWIPKYFGPSLGVASEASTDLDIRPARITFFAKHPIRVHGNLHTHLLACISWFKHHSDQAALGNLKPMTIWEYDIFEPPGNHSIIPVQFIQSRAVSLVDKLNEPDGPTVLFVVPCIDF